MTSLRITLSLITASLCCCLFAANDDDFAIRTQKKNVAVRSEIPFDLNVIWSHIAAVEAELAASLNVYSSGEPIRIFIFADQSRYEQHLMADFPQCRHRKAIFVRQEAISSIYTFQSRTLIQDIRHEYTHALLHQHLPFLPIWLDEGLAEYFEEPVSTRMESSRAANIRWKAKVGWTPRLESLENIPSANDIDADSYRDSWAWACLLLNESAESRDMLRDYLQRIHGGEDPPPFGKFAGRVLPDLRKRSGPYFRRLTLREVAKIDSPSP